MEKNINNNGIRTREPKSIAILDHMMWQKEIGGNKPLSIDEIALNEGFSDWIERISQAFSGDKSSASLKDVAEAIYQSYCHLKADSLILLRSGINNVANILDIVDSRDFKLISFQLNDPNSEDDRLVISESKDGISARTMNSKIRSDEGRPYEKVSPEILRKCLLELKNYSDLIMLSHGFTIVGNPSLELSVDGNVQKLFSSQRVRITIKSSEDYDSEYCISIAFIIGGLMTFDPDTSYAKINGKLVRLSPKVYQKAAKEVLIDCEYLKRYGEVFDLMQTTKRK